MAKFKNELEIKGKVKFLNVDPHVCRMEMEENGSFLSGRKFDVPRNFLPADFDPSVHEVAGAFKIVLSAKEK